MVCHGEKVVKMRTIQQTQGLGDSLTDPSKRLTSWMEGYMAALEMMNRNRFGELFHSLPVELQSRVFSFMAMPNSAKNKGAETLHAAASVNRHWRFLAEDPQLWVKCRPIITANTSAEELVAALQFRRFLKVNPSNFRIKDCPQLARSEINFGLQTRVEMLHGLDDQVRVRARWVLKTPGGKVALHDRMRRGLNSNRVLRLNIVTGMAPSRKAWRLRGGYCISALRNIATQNL